MNEQTQLLIPFWETVLDRSPDDMKTQMVIASHFAKINAVFLSKKPAEVNSPPVPRILVNTELRALRCSPSFNRNPRWWNDYFSTSKHPLLWTSWFA